MAACGPDGSRKRWRTLLECSAGMGGSEAEALVISLIRMIAA